MPILLSLDMSAAFDTILHAKLLDRLQTDFGICGMALQFFSSYLNDRYCYVASGDAKSETWRCTQGVPQGSVLGPLLFSLYVSPIAKILTEARLNYHQYADDIQLYTAIKSGLSIDSVVKYFKYKYLKYYPKYF